MKQIKSGNKHWSYHYHTQSFNTQFKTHDSLIYDCIIEGNNIKGHDHISACKDIFFPRHSRRQKNSLKFFRHLLD